jgi:hypothetical protein
MQPQQGGNEHGKADVPCSSVRGTVQYMPIHLSNSAFRCTQVLYTQVPQVLRVISTQEQLRQVSVLPYHSPSLAETPESPSGLATHPSALTPMQSTSSQSLHGLSNIVAAANPPFLLPPLLLFFVSEPSTFPSRPPKGSLLVVLRHFHSFRFNSPSLTC